MRLTDAQTEEYGPVLSDLLDKYVDTKQQIAELHKVEKSLKKRVSEIADFEGGENTRVLIPVQNRPLMFDRRISFRGGDIVYEDLCDHITPELWEEITDTIRIVNPIKLEEARKLGKITEEILLEVTSSVTSVSSLYTPDFVEMEEDEDDSL